MIDNETFIEKHTKEHIYYLMAFKSNELLLDPLWLEWRDHESNDCILHVAASHSPVMLARLLKTAGGKGLKDHPNYSKQTPLYKAVYANQIESVRLLMLADAHTKCDFGSNVCPVKLALARHNFEAVITMILTRLTEKRKLDWLHLHYRTDKEPKFLESHVDSCAPKYKPYLLHCINIVNARRDRARQTIITALFVLHQKIGKKQKDVFQFILKPLFQSMWDHQQHDAAWDRR